MAKKRADTAKRQLAEYAKKRKFDVTSEPRGRLKTSRKKPIFVIHKHDASNLHYDVRLEVDGVLKSWAVPKGPINDPDIKRLAARVEDHPYDYKDFEGVIPEGEYGGGPVIIWDYGTYTPVNAVKFNSNFVDKGTLEFKFEGKKMKGTWALFRFKKEKDKELWMLKKSKKDKMPGPKDITARLPRSAKSNKTIAEVKRDAKFK